LQNPGAYADNLKRNYSNSEQLLWRRWGEEGLQVRRFPRMLFICASEGDLTRGQTQKDYTTPEGVRLKYEDEYCDSQRTCHPEATRANRRWIFGKKSCQTILHNAGAP
jgi:hypothetical protein